MVKSENIGPDDVAVNAPICLANNSKDLETEEAWEA
jgi:hypothetical protein